MTTSHELYCWGEGSSGQLGYGDEVDRVEPTVMLDGVDSVSAGLSHTCAGMIERMGERTMNCWGHNESGQLGLNSFIQWNTPKQLENLTNVALTGRGRLAHVRRAGARRGLLLGQRSTVPPRDRPCERRSVAPGDPEARGRDLDLARRAALRRGRGGRRGAPVGRQHEGQLGTGTLDPGLMPQSIGLTDVVELALGDDHSCALKRTGEMLCWGDNRNGELGDGTIEPRLVPTRVAWPAPP